MLYLSLKKGAAQSIAIQIREKNPVLQGIPVNLETIHIKCRLSPQYLAPKVLGLIMVKNCAFPDYEPRNILKIKGMNFV